jgi:trans-aconitate methyltransferase
MPFEPVPRHRRTDLDFDAPTQARATDALLGGRDNYEVDRALVDRVLRIAPEATEVARDHRAWVARALRFLAVHREVDQFVDLGCGLPRADNTHQVVQRHRPAARVVYVDNDPVVAAAGRALLEENDHTHVAEVDLTEPASALYDRAFATWDPDRPTALVLTNVLHHIPDLATAQTVVKGWLTALAPDSYLVMSHLATPGDGGQVARRALAVEAALRDTPMATTHRTVEELNTLLADLTPVAPGLVPLHEWWPDGPQLRPVTPLHTQFLAVVAHKP